MLTDGKAFAEDGVAVMARGDVFLIVYQLAARLHRTRWLFRHMDTFLDGGPQSIIALMVVLPTADTPDAATRAENSAGLRRVGTRLRRMVTAPVGDAFRVSIVRTIMRALAAIQGKSGVHFVTNTIDQAIARAREAASAATPAAAQLTADLEALYGALGVPFTR